MASQAWMKQSTSSCCTVCVSDIRVEGRGGEEEEGRGGRYEAGRAARVEGKGIGYRKDEEEEGMTVKVGG